MDNNFKNVAVSFMRDGLEGDVVMWLEGDVVRG
jgi:hypothetical protein